MAGAMYVQHISTPRHLILASLAALAGLAAALLPAHGTAPALAQSADPSAGRLQVPADAEQLIVVSSPTSDPPAPGYLASLRAYERAGSASPWRTVFSTWQAETGSGHLLPADPRREGDHATPIGVFGIGATMYGNEPNPGGLHYAYHRLVCGDWWDEDPYSPQYNRFVHVPLRVHAPVRGLVGGALDRDDRLPLLRGDRVQHEPDDRGRKRAGLGHLPAQLGGRSDRGMRGAARGEAARAAALAGALCAPGDRDLD